LKIREESSNLTQYGQDEVKRIVEFINNTFASRPQICQDTCASEWYSLKLYIFHEWPSDKDLNVLWQKVRTRSFLKELKTVLHCYFSLPLGTASVERSFSTMNSIKTSFRNRINEELLDALLMIKYNGPILTETSYIINDAINIWKSKKKRRFV